MQFGQLKGNYYCCWMVSQSGPWYRR